MYQFLFQQWHLEKEIVNYTSKINIKKPDSFKEEQYPNNKIENHPKNKNSRKHHNKNKNKKPQEKIKNLEKRLRKWLIFLINYRNGIHKKQSLDLNTSKLLMQILSKNKSFIENFEII